MKLKQLFTDDSAVSPVIGVILMVAITVILAAVIGTFVLNLGGSVSQTAPQASFGFDFENDTSDYVTITHESGATIVSDRLELKSSKAVDISKDSSSFESNTNMTTSESFAESDAFDSGTKVSAGDTVYVGGESLDLNGQTFRVVWSSETGESSATLSDWTAPSN